MRLALLLLLCACGPATSSADGGTDAGDASTTCNVVIVVCEIGDPSCPNFDAGD